MKMAKLDDFTKPQKPWEVEGVEWREVRLGKACIINPKKSEVRNLLFQNIEVSFVPMEYVDDVKGKIVRVEIKLINQVYKGYTYFKEGDVLFAKITPCMENGKSAVARNLKNGIGFGSTEFHVLRPTENVLSDFIFYFIRRKRFRNLAKAHFTGTVGHKRVPKEFLINSKIPLPFRNGKPDLETQKKIVEYIEVNFSIIDKILEKKKKELERLDELWESVLEQAFKPKEGEEWREVRFNELISKEKYQVGKVKVRNGLTNSGKIPVVDQSQELIRGYLDNEKLKYKGPLPLVIFGDHTKVVKFIDFPFIVGADGVKILIPNKHLVYPNYFYWLLKTVKLPERGYARHFKFLKQALYLIPFRNGKPDLEMQKEIVNYLDSVYEKIKTLKEKIQNQITWLEEMKESILDEVFNYDEAG